MVSVLTHYGVLPIDFKASFGIQLDTSGRLIGTKLLDIDSLAKISEEGDPTSAGLLTLRSNAAIPFAEISESLLIAKELTEKPHLIDQIPLLRELLYLDILTRVGALDPSLRNNVFPGYKFTLSDLGILAGEYASGTKKAPKAFGVDVYVASLEVIQDTLKSSISTAEVRRDQNEPDTHIARVRREHRTPLLMRVLGVDETTADKLLIDFDRGNPSEKIATNSEFGPVIAWYLQHAFDKDVVSATNAATGDLQVASDLILESLLFICGQQGEKDRLYNQGNVNILVKIAKHLTGSGKVDLPGFLLELAQADDPLTVLSQQQLTLLEKKG